MNLEALALARAEEQIRGGAWRRQDEPEPARRPCPPLGIRPPLGGRPVSCLCGRCQKCRNREWMRAQRGGLLTAKLCVQCGRAIRGYADWCGACRQRRPAQFRAYAQSMFNDGGGI